MNELARAIGSVVIGSILPYPDPRRRRRVRRAARSLVGAAWPPDDQVTGHDLAGLALLRALALQKRTRRVATLRQSEAAVLLARTALETCIVGLYCLYDPDAANRMRKADSRIYRKLVGFLIDDIDVPEDFTTHALAALGDQAAAPTLPNMIKTIDAHLGGTNVAELYNRFYVPLSTYYSHASMASLLPHVQPGRQITSKASNPWTRRSPAHLADTCVGLLAANLASQLNAPGAHQFLAYAQAHRARTLNPQAVMMAKALLRTHWRKLFRVMRSVAKTRRYLAGPGLHDPLPVREARIRATFNLLTFDPDVAAAMQPAIDGLVDNLLRDPTASAPDSVSP